ncbi:phage tail protein [Qipengyuania sp. YG27]|uniref:Phage tail protein n=1 Tax=Qipengyuania mesophila TaxID=2867246 RepID=A0ABS7JTW4_9SPHN|nr:phage tail protein [Qipengyuania mesophila]MBX7501095.1 phage tail protein [Qipengyuania mesophila]
MATLVLGALGTLVGGPLGGALGATLGRSLDAMIIGSPRREGPRLKELAVSTSSYGQPVPALYGKTRVAGTVIWATDLEERRETSGGGKGKPRTTSYSYSVSLAVALSSRPIDAVGRIWADGNLLRGRAGDLKTGGTLRCHSGHADQQPDPLMAAAIGPQCPAHRGCAYVVFEDLALEDFGNRIPALSFEVLASPASGLVPDIAALGDMDSSNAAFPELAGFIHEGGSPAQVLALVDRLRPLAVTEPAGIASIEGIVTPGGDIPMLPLPSAWEEGEFGREDGRTLSRRSGPAGALSALRYYDPVRDYQPGLQRAEGLEPARGQEVLEFPGTFSASDARSLVALASAREQQDREQLAWRMAELDPDLGPGSIVRAPGQTGLWRITGWEWRERGIELELVRFVAPSPASVAGDGGSAWTPADRDAVATRLRAFELPWDGIGSSASVQRYVALGAPTGRWSGAALYRSSGAALEPLAQGGPVRAVSGTLLDAVGPNPGLRLDPAATLRLALDDAESELEPATTTALALGANRLLVGSEVLQFAQAEPEGGGVWRLAGLLRGRGGTEREALAGHAPGTPATLLDERLLALPSDLSLAQGDRLAAIGLAEDEPVTAILEDAGRSRRLPFPVHPRSAIDAQGALTLGWTRRARGGWAWLDEVDQPLVEQVEAYEVGLGAPDTPAALWTVSAPCLVLSAAEVANLSALHPGEPLWVRQKGSFAKSAPLYLATLPALA